MAASFRGEIVLSAKSIERTFNLGGEDVHALRKVDLDIYRGELVAIMGRSGSGKTTLLNILGGLDMPSSGTVYFLGKNIIDMNSKELTDLRRRQVAFVFQALGLLPLLSAMENVELPLRIAGWARGAREDRTVRCLELVGLQDRASHRPYELSGGEQQRVAVARAIAPFPPLILADEPTGELDSANAMNILNVLRQVVNEEGVTVVMATHDPNIGGVADRTLELKDGYFVGA